MRDMIRATGLVKKYRLRRGPQRARPDSARGQRAGPAGPNGAGKTTAVRILTTLLEPDAGAPGSPGIDVLRRAQRGAAR